ncbi:hypothetical protein ACFY5J_27015 [Peribacillus butanolivorans]|uniref:hypothetical protein n=1 Tax=Peribacillus butanolivorans TaxID=421767 RepID=UPI0036995647
MEEEKKPFKYTKKSGNTTLIIHSDLMKLTEEERAQWWEDEIKKGNKKVLAIIEAMRNCYRYPKDK